MTASCHGRSLADVFGNESLLPVREADLCADAIAMLSFVAGVRRVYVVVEQPAGSLFYAWPAMAMVARTMSLDCCHTWLGGFGASTPKPLDLLHNLPPWAALWLQRSRSIAFARCEGNARLTWVSVSGAVHGTPAMHESQTYPDEFGFVVAALLQALLAL